MKNEDVEIAGKFLRAKRLEEKRRAKKTRTHIANSDGGFMDTIQHDNDLVDNIPYSRNFRTAYRNE